MHLEIARIDHTNASKYDEYSLILMSYLLHSTIFNGKKNSRVIKAFKLELCYFQICHETMVGIFF